MPAPLTVVIFGASGDLTARKLIPSLYNLAVKQRLPEEAKILGVARQTMRGKLRGAGVRVTQVVGSDEADDLERPD